VISCPLHDAGMTGVDATPIATFARGVSAKKDYT
jgi:hypothetical protein